MSVKIEFSGVCSRQQVEYFEVSYPNTNPAGQGLTAATFYLGKLSEGQSTSLNFWQKRVLKELENDQHVSREANVARFRFIFVNLSGINTLLNHMFSQRVFSKDIYQGTIMIYDTKTISCAIRATYYAKTT